MLQAIIFDLDGVIIDSEPLMRFAFAEAYRRVIGDGVPPIEAYLEHMGESFPRIVERLGLPISLWEPYRELCQSHIDRINVFAGARRTLEWARAQRLKLAILTGKDRARTLQILEHFDLDRYFDLVITSDQLRRPKPDPEGMQRALDHFDCPAEEAVMVGDAVSDILCAQRAGVTAVAVTWGIKPERVQTLCRPDHIVHSWSSLMRVLRTLEAQTIRPGAGLTMERGRQWTQM